MSDRISNRELNEQKEKEDLKKVGLGDLMAEMIAIGDPTDVYTKRSRGKVKRAQFIQEELNRRGKSRRTKNTSKSE